MNTAAVSFHQGWQNCGVYLDNEWLYIKNTEPRSGFPQESLIPEELYHLTDDAACKNNLVNARPLPLSILARSRGIISSIVMAPEELVFSCAGPRDSEVEVTFTCTNGEIVSFSHQPKVIKQTKKSITFEVSPTDRVRMVCSPVRAEGIISARTVRGPLTTRDILCGAYALPLVDDFAIKQSRRQELMGWPQDLPKTETPKVVVGIVPVVEGDVQRSNAAAGSQLRSMLEEWGYINQ